MHYRNLFAALVLAASLEFVQAQGDGVWTSASGGSWANTGNWLDGIIADGPENTATLGFSLYPINTSATFTLNGARTIGNLSLTAHTTPAAWSLNSGTGGPLTLATTFDYPAVTVNPAGLQCTINSVITGADGLEKFGAGTLILTATNNYSGGTILSGGALLLHGKLTDTNALTVTSGTLGGTGMISGPLIVQSGGTFSPGNPLGTFTLSNSLTLLAGSKTVVTVNATTLAHDFVPGISTANYGGKLTVSNLAGTPALGQNFPIFNTASSSGNFSSITPQLTGGLRWRFDPVSGILTVVSTNLQPKFASLALLNKASLALLVTNGTPGGTNYLLASTNLALPRTNWTPLATNAFDAGGNLNLTVPVMQIPQQFLLISAP